MGIVPVLLAETYDPPLSQKLFESSVLIVEENESAILNLDDLIRSIPIEKIQEMLQNLQSLKLLYGKESFIYDVVELICNSEKYHTSFLDIVSRSPRMLAISLSSKILLGEIKDKNKVSYYASLVFEKADEAGSEAVNILKNACTLKGFSNEE
jgi:hypothetical protein